jgi:subtilisin family serine protease
VEPNNTSEKDNFGHGTAMGTIIKDVAKAAKVYAVRMSKQDPSVSEGMLGMCAGSFHYKADIINLSSSLPEGTTCSQCGAQPGVSKVLKRFLESLSEKAISSNGKPLVVAATGNNYKSSGFASPARWDFVLAIGSITEAKDRSDFSNYGTTPHGRYFMMPGGEKKQYEAAPREWVGEATEKCFGTSAAAAYASSVLALYMSDPKYKNLDRDAFLKDVLGQCQRCNNQNALEHGEGYLKYIPRP